MRITSGTTNSNEVIPLLWQGCAPSPGEISPRVQLLVLCAMEYQPDKSLFPGPAIYRLPIDDAQPTMREVGESMKAAREVARSVGAGRLCLVTCRAGLNRSGLVTGLALRYLGVSGSEAVRLVKAARGPNALSNEHFRRIVESP